MSEDSAPPPVAVAYYFTEVMGPVELAGDFRGRRLHTFFVWRLRARADPK